MPLVSFWVIVRTVAPLEAEPVAARLNAPDSTRSVLPPNTASPIRPTLLLSINGAVLRVSPRPESACRAPPLKEIGLPDGMALTAPSWSTALVAIWVPPP